MAELSETDDSVVLEATYSGEKFDPMKDGNEISAALVKNASAMTRHRYEDGSNKFRSVIRNRK